MSQEKTVLEIATPILIAFLGLIGLFWGKIQAWNRGRIFQKLIFRELEEFIPKDSTKETVDISKWTNYIQNKKFIHREIFDNTTGNRDFILSLNEELVYNVKQFWDEVESQVSNTAPIPDETQFHYYVDEIIKYAYALEKFPLPRKRYRGIGLKMMHKCWFEIFKNYNQNQEGCPFKVDVTKCYRDAASD